MAETKDENVARALDRVLAVQREQGAWTSAFALLAASAKLAELAREAVELAAMASTDAAAAGGAPAERAAKAKTLHDDAARAARAATAIQKDAGHFVEDARGRGLREALDVTTAAQSQTAS